MSGDQYDNESFIERIAKPLRAPERVDATFEARAMSAVHAAARQGEGEGEGETQHRSWWMRSRTVRINPLASLALAAGFAGLVLAGAQLVDSISRGPRNAPLVASNADTVHIVRFVFVDAAARQVALVGEFNQWEKGATLLNASAAPGVWTVDVPLPAGRHEYAFVVSDAKGERWVADPTALSRRDEFGTESSVISVGVKASS